LRFLCKRVIPVVVIATTSEGDTTVGSLPGIVLLMANYCLSATKQ